MIKTHSILQQTALQSALQAESYLKPRAGKWKRALAADLLLTALIDAFSILVIFLLMSFSSTGDLLFIGKDQELPKAAQVDLLERNPVVKIEAGKMYLEDKEVTSDSIVAAFLEMRKQFSDSHPGQEYPGVVTIQADRRLKYEALNQVVLAASHAGFSDVRFAVLLK
ncbi:MAG: biopolymer transporter ExbD [Bdellovibrio sp. CG10_big_fil_rev_8_21_14_0_10_47_8]|nr:MAG: biopolymer transporter ExbD [Bdellovibrio sp. CG10_big_fil_rev_8_21_14_0_10_47_8]